MQVEPDNSSRIDLDVPHLRPVFSDGTAIFSAFLALFIILMVLSCIGNFTVLLLIVKQKLYKENLTLCLANLMVTHSLQVCLVLPVCLYTRLVQNWVLGEVVCYVLPVISVVITPTVRLSGWSEYFDKDNAGRPPQNYNFIIGSTHKKTFETHLKFVQDLPSHLCLLTLFTGNLIRYGKLLFPQHSRPTPALLLPLCWLVSLLLALPCLPHIQWRLLAAQGPRLVGGQLCLYQEDEYSQGRMVRGTFLLLVTVPVLTSLYLLCRVWWVLTTMERLGSTRATTSESTEVLDNTRDSTDTINSGDNNNDDR